MEALVERQRPLDGPLSRLWTPSAGSEFGRNRYSINDSFSKNNSSTPTTTTTTTTTSSTSVFRIFVLSLFILLYLCTQGSGLFVPCCGHTSHKGQLVVNILFWFGRLFALYPLLLMCLWLLR